MGNSRTADARKPISQRTTRTGQRKGPKVTSADDGNTGDSSTAQRPRPRMVQKGQPLRREETLEGAAAALVALRNGRSGAQHMIDRALGISEEEARELDEDPEAELEYEEGEEAENVGMDDVDGFVADDGHSSRTPTPAPHLSVPEFSITFEIPYKNAVRELILPSSTSYPTFLCKVAEKMETRITLLSAIGWLASYRPKNAKLAPKLLEDTAAYQRMLVDIADYIQTSKAKNKGKGVVKAFSIQIIDTSDATSPEKGPRSKGGLKKASSLEPALKVSDTEEKEHELIRDIETRHRCQEHKGKSCYVQTDGKHYQYTNEDLSIWAHLLRKKLATIDAPPDKLNITDKARNQDLIKRRTSGHGGPSAIDPMSMWSAAMPYGPPSPWFYGGYPSLTPPPPPPPPPSDNSQSDTTASSSRKRAPSDTPLIPIQYPTISTWLQSLDEHRQRGQDNLNYAQYTEILSANGIVRLEDLLDVGTPEKLQAVSGINWGTANRLLKFAEADKKELLEQVKRAHVDD